LADIEREDPTTRRAPLAVRGLLMIPMSTKTDVTEANQVIVRIAAMG